MSLRPIEHCAKCGARLPFHRLGCRERTPLPPLPDVPDPVPARQAGTVDAIHMREAIGPCEVHDWPTDGMAVRLVDRMRTSHGKGGVNVCVDCIARARLSVDILRKL